jgi:hypothetical protein
MSSELNRRGHETDTPAETGSGTDRDVVSVPVYAGRNVGITRAEARAQARAEFQTRATDSTGAKATDSGNDRTGTDRSDGAARQSDSSQSRESASADRSPDGAHNVTAGEGRDRGTPEDSSAARPGGLSDSARTRDGSDAEVGTGEADFRPRTDAADPGTAAADWRASPDSLSDARERPGLGSLDRQALSDGSGHEDARVAGTPDVGTTGRRDRDGPQDRDEGDAGERSQNGPESAEPRPQRAELKNAETAEHKEKDQAARPDQTPDAKPSQPGEIAEARPDQHVDDQRLATLEQRLDANDAKVENLKADYEAKLNGVRDEYEAKISSLEASRAQDRQQIEDLQQKIDGRDESKPASSFPDTAQPGEHSEKARPDQEVKSRWQESELSQEHMDKEAVQPENDRKGLFSNAKIQIYGTLASGGFAAAASEYSHTVSPAEAGIIGTGIVALANFIPVWRERRRTTKNGD